MDPDLRFAHELADAADGITLARFGASDLRVETKPDLSPVSEADRAAEAAIRDLVARERRDEGVYGEELGQESGASARWIVDPIDGTRNYVRGVPIWGTLLALERDGQVDVALASAPALVRRWSAVRGEGAWTGGKRIHVSSVDEIGHASVSTTSAPDMPQGWHELAAAAWTSRALGDFWQYCLVAEGALDIAADERLELWDYAAIQLIVEEAGGSCSTFDGEPPTAGRSFLASNGRLHEAALALVRGQTP